MDPSRSEWFSLDRWTLQVETGETYALKALSHLTRPVVERLVLVVCHSDVAISRKRNQFLHPDLLILVVLILLFSSL